MHKKSKLQIILISYLILNILHLLIGMGLRYYKVIKYQQFSYDLIFFLIINIFIILMIFIKKKYKFHKIDLFILLCILFGTISLQLSYDFKISLYGFNGRFEGFYQILYYLSIMFITTFIDKENKKYIINIIIFTGIIQAIIGILQVYDIRILGIRELKLIKGIKKATGFISNSNFYGTYILMCLSYITKIYIEKQKHLITLILLIIALLISNALSCFAGYIILLVIITIKNIKQKNIKTLAILLTTFISLLILLTLTNKTNMIKRVKTTSDETMEIATGNLDDNYGTKRIFIWKNTIKIIPKHYLHGVGIDCFYYAFDKPLTKNGKVFYDKAHNEYLNTLITQGVFALISYIGLHIIVLKEGKKQNNNYPIISYIVQSLFNVSVIEVAPLFYISCALTIERSREN